jgi:hypothetical protein
LEPPGVDPAPVVPFAALDPFPLPDAFALPEPLAPVEPFASPSDRVPGAGSRGWGSGIAQICG